MAEDGKHNQNHWLLAGLGKKVLRPGGKELTLKLMDSLQISEADDVVEFAPGMGQTASLLLANKLNSYKGIEINKEAAERLREEIEAEHTEIINKSAGETGLEEASVHKIIAEAMLAMQEDQQKEAVIKEAFRILQKGGLYGIHELALKPDNIDKELKNQILNDMSNAVHINARPLTKKEWMKILSDQGFKVKNAYAAPIQFLDAQQMIIDEGIFGAMKIQAEVRLDPGIEERVNRMRKIFRKYSDNLVALAITAEK